MVHKVWSQDHQSVPHVNLLEMKLVRIHLRPTESGTLRVGVVQESELQRSLQVILNACSSLRTVTLQVVLMQKSPDCAQLTLLVCCPEYPEASKLCWVPIHPHMFMSSPLSLASVLQGTALIQLLKEAFSPFVGKHYRPVVKRTVFRGREPLVGVLALWLMSQARCFSLYPSVPSSEKWA